MRHDLEQLPVRILERDHLLAGAALLRPLVLHAVLQQSVDPETERAGERLERRHSHLTSALTSVKRPRPGKERHDAARMPDVVAEIEVICVRVVEVDRALHEAQSEKSDEEIEVAL